MERGPTRRPSRGTVKESVPNASKACVPTAKAQTNSSAKNASAGPRVTSGIAHITRALAGVIELVLTNKPSLN